MRDLTQQQFAHEMRKSGWCDCLGYWTLHYDFPSGATYSVHQHRYQTRRAALAEADRQKRLSSYEKPFPSHMRNRLRLCSTRGGK